MVSDSAATAARWFSIASTLRADGSTASGEPSIGAAATPVRTAEVDQSASQVGQRDDSRTPRAGRGRPARERGAEPVEHLQAGIVRSRGWADAGDDQGEVVVGGEAADHLVRSRTGVDQGDRARARRTAGQVVLCRLIGGEGAVGPSGRQGRAGSDRRDAAGDRAGQRAQLGVAPPSRGGLRTRLPVDDAITGHLRIAQPAHSGAPSGAECGPAGRGTVADVARPDRDAAGLRPAQVRVEDCAVGVVELGAPGQPDHDHPLGEDRRGLRRLRECGQAAQPGEDPGQQEQQSDRPKAWMHLPSASTRCRELHQCGVLSVSEPEAGG